MARSRRSTEGPLRKELREALRVLNATAEAMVELDHDGATGSTLPEEHLQLLCGSEIGQIEHWLALQERATLLDLLRGRWQARLAAARELDEFAQGLQHLPKRRRTSEAQRLEFGRKERTVIFTSRSVITALRAVEEMLSEPSASTPGKHGPEPSLPGGRHGQAVVLIDGEAGWIQVASSGRVSFTSEEMAALTAAREEEGGVDASTLRTEHSISNPRRTLASLRDKLNVHPPLAAAYDADKQDGKWRLVWKAGRPTNPGQAPERYVAVT